VLEAAAELNMYQQPFHFYTSNIATAFNAFSPLVRSLFDGRVTGSVSLPPDTADLRELLAFRGSHELRGFERIVETRSIVAYAADAVKVIFEAASRERYSWQFGQNPERTRAALIRGMDSLTAERPLLGPSLGTFSFDENKDVIVNVDQVTLRPHALVPFMSRSSFSDTPTPADVLAFESIKAVKERDIPCEAPPVADDIATGGTKAEDERWTQVLIGALVGCIAAVLTLVLLVLLRQRKKRGERRFDLLAWLKANQIASAWVPPRLTADALKLEDRIGEGAYGAVYSGKLMRRPGAFTRFDAQNGTLRDGSARQYPPPRPDLPALSTSPRGSTQRQPIPVAVKQLKFLPNQGDFTSLMREAMTLSLFTGKHYIVQPIAMTLAPQLTLVLEHCVYGSLDQLLLRAFMMDRPLTWLLKLRIATQLSRALDAVHSWKLMHNDVAARNVLVTSNFVCKLADFGLARRVDFSSSGPDCPRMPVRWTSPETLQGAFSCANDVWALGITLWEVAIDATGVPYGNMTEIGVIEAVCNNQLLPMPTKTPPEVASIIKACWRPAEARPRAAELTVLLFATRNLFGQDAPPLDNGKRAVAALPSLSTAAATFGRKLLAADALAAGDEEARIESAAESHRSAFVDETYEDSDDEDSQRWRGEAAMHQFMAADAPDAPDDAGDDIPWTAETGVCFTKPSASGSSRTTSTEHDKYLSEEELLDHGSSQMSVNTRADLGAPGEQVVKVEPTTALLRAHGQLAHKTRYTNVSNLQQPPSSAVPRARKATVSLPDHPPPHHAPLIAHLLSRGNVTGYSHLTAQAQTSSEV
jgi:serine/threonine protein kinase